MLHPWLQTELPAILAELPEPTERLSPEENRRRWERWQEELTVSIRRILKRRALDGEHPTTPDEIIAWLEATARGWNRAPTPFIWGASAKRGASGPVRDVTDSEAPAPVPINRSIAPRPLKMAILNPADPLAADGLIHAQPAPPDQTGACDRHKCPTGLTKQ